MVLTNGRTTLVDFVVFLDFFVLSQFFCESGIQIHAEGNTLGQNSSLKTQNGPDTG